MAVVQGTKSEQAKSTAVEISGELLIDGGFETAKVGAKSWTHQAEVGGWKSATEVEVWGKEFYGIKATQGDKFAELDFDHKASNIYQDVATEEGAEYTFTFDYMKRPDSKAGSDTIEVFWNGKLLGSVDPQSSSWSAAEFKVIGTGGKDRIEFREAASDNDSYGGLIDNASLKKSGPSTAEQKAQHDHDDVIIGTAKVDALGGDEHANVVLGLGSNDEILGGAGDDALYGGGSEKVGAADLNNLKVAEDFTGSVTFDGEGAGYKNALGVYDIAADGSISNVRILFANASAKGSGGDLVGGQSTVGLDLTAGSKLGFFIVPNGFGVSNANAKLLSGTSFELRSNHGGPASVDGGPVSLWSIDANGKATQVKSAYGADLFHSVDGLNADGISHVVSSVDPAAGTLSLAFEDLKGGGDKDFDDVKFTVNLGEVNAHLVPKAGAGHGRGTNDDFIAGGDGDDRIYGGSGDDELKGDAGNDQVWGSSGSDTVSGGVGDDKLYGGKGDDVLSDGAGSDLVKGDSGDDLVYAGEGDDEYSGGEGFDTLDFSFAAGGVAVDLSKKTASGMGQDKVSGFEEVIGSKFADKLMGSKQAETLAGGAGDDYLRSAGGADVLTGGEGADTFAFLSKDVVDVESGAHLGVDRITDFGKGDRLDISGMVKGPASLAAQNVKVTDGAAGTMVSVKMGDKFVDVVMLEGVHDTDLLAHGMILT